MPIGIGTPRSVSAIGSVGALTDGFRFELPPGRRGVAPTLALLYNSLSGDGVAGVGWQFETGSIRRSAKKGIPAFDGSEAFVFSLAGTKTDLVEVAPGEYRAERESTYRSYEFVEEHWLVRDARGNRYVFGSLPENRIGLDVWMLERIEDLNGNYVALEYVEDAGELQVLAIHYTGHDPSGTLPANHVSFAYEPRPDVRSTYVHGARQLLALRPAEVVVMHGASVVRSFVLNYEASASTGRTRLQSIDVVGRDGGSIRARTFGYSEAPAGFTGGVATGTLPLQLYDEDGRDTGVRPVDVNGDGRVDLLDNGQAVWLGDGAGGFVEDPDWSSAVASLGLSLVDGDGRNLGTQLSDVNADGRPDFISAPFGGTRAVYVSDGLGWTESASHSGSLAALTESARTERRFLSDPCNEPEDPDPDPALLPCDEEIDVDVEFSIVQKDGDSAGAFFADVNGDGLVDILWSVRTTDLLADFETEEGGGNTGRTPVFVQAVFLNDGTGWTKSPDLSNELSRLPPFVVDSQFQGFDVMDVNGDGLADVVNTSADATRAVYLNTTNGWVEDPDYSADLQASAVVSLSGNVAQGLAVTDFNGDGLIDLLRADESTTVALRNTGTGFESDAGVAQALADLGVAFSNADGEPTGYQLLDLSADGRPDLLFSRGGDGSSIRFAAPGRSDLLVDQETALGESTSISYQLSTDFSHRDENGVERFPIILPFAALIVRDDGAGNFFTQAYDYEGAVFDEGGFKGIRTSTVFTSEGLQRVTTVSLDGDLAGRPTIVDTLDANGDLRRREALVYSTFEPAPGVVQVNVAESTQTTFDEGAEPVSVRVRRLHDEYLNLTDLFKDGDVGLADDDVHEHYDFVRNLNLGFVAEIARATTMGPDGEVLSDTRHFYDDLPLGDVSRGNLTRIVESIDELGNESIRTVSYDDFGNPISATDGIGRLVSFGYDDSATYRRSMTDPLDRTKITEKDPATGLVVSETDENGATTTRDYDAFGRLVRETLPGDEPSPFGTRSVEYSPLGSGQSYAIRSTETAGEAETFDTALFYGGFGWVYRIYAEGSGGRTVVVDQGFDGQGELSERTIPYFEGEPSTTIATARDVLGRVVSQDFGDETAELTEYSGLERIETDRRGNVSVRTVDAFDQTVQMVRLTADLELLTSYEYDAFGRRTAVVDAGGNLTQLSYDRLGRRVHMVDPVRGTLDYEYDEAGQLLSEGDGGHGVTRYEYNDSGDLTKKRLATGEVFEFEYGDASVFGVGRVVKATDPAGTVRMEFDARGNAIERRRKTGRRLYVTRYEFDSLGRVREIAYPDGFEVGYAYGPSTQPVSITDGKGRPVVSSIEYAATGRVTSIHYGNDVVAEYAYDEQGRLVVADVESPHGNTIQSDRYGYDAGGNVVTLDNLFDPRFSQTFEYDELNRLTRAESSKASYGVEEYEYDAIGNLIKKGDLVYHFDGDNDYQPTCVIEDAFDHRANVPRSHWKHPCAKGWSDVRHRRTSGRHAHREQSYKLEWDRRGNLVRKNSLSFQYDYEGRLRRVSDGGRVTQRNRYSAAGQRVLRWTPKLETVFIDEIYETDSAMTRRHVPLGSGGRLAATLTSRGRAPLLSAWGLHGWRASSRPRWSGALLAMGLLSWLCMMLSTRRGRMTVEIFARLTAWELRSNLRYVRLRPKLVSVALAVLGVLLIHDTGIAYAHGAGRDRHDESEYHFYHHDHLGSTKAITDVRGHVVNRAEYTPFGEPLRSGSMEGPPATQDSYAGMRVEGRSGAEPYHARSRFYDAVLGRFTSPDIVVPGEAPEALNRYAFNLNNPMRHVDLTGRGFWDVVLGVVVVVALVAATIVTLGAAGVLTGLVLAIAIGAAIGTGVGAIAAVILAATGQIDSFSDGAFFTLAGTIIGAAAGGAVGTAAAAFGAKATLLSQIGFGAFAGGTLGAISGGSATLINGDVDNFLLGVVIGGAIGAAVGAVFGGVSLPAAVTALEKGGTIAVLKLIGSLAATSASLVSLSFNGTAEVLDLEKRIPQRVFEASLALGVAGFATPLLPAVGASGGEQVGMATVLGAL